MIAAVRRRAVDASLSVSVFLTVFLFRFNPLGGALGGFTNDEFGYLARARQIQSGEVPFRDFNDPGWFLTDGLAAAMQWLGGYNLRSEALLTVGLLSLGIALTFLLARRAADSWFIALFVTGVHAWLDVRHYNYPKILIYAVGLALAWAYIDRPTVGRRVALGALVGVGFLFRHDNLVYLGALSLVAVACVHHASPRVLARAALGIGAVAAVFVVPFLVFLAQSGGVGEYFRTALVYVTRDAQRTTFSFPTFSLDRAQPFLTLSRDPVAAVAHINVRWASASTEERLSREARYHLGRGELVEETTWAYVLDDTSSPNIEALIRDPLVEDTQGLNRTAFTVTGASRPLRLRTQLDAVPNATAFLYYLFLALPFVATLALWRLGRGLAVPERLVGIPHLVPLILLAFMLNIGLLSRGSTNIRVPDVGVTSSILLAWLVSVVAGRDGRRLVRGAGARLGIRCALAGVLLLTVCAANGLAQGARRVAEAGFADGPGELVRRASTTWRRLGAHPSTFLTDSEQPAILRVAAYVAACTAPEDRLFILGEHPALYYFSDRRFAGGHAWLLPRYYTGDADEARIVARLKANRVPIVLTESGPTYDEDYRPDFEQIHAYLEREYVVAGEIDHGGSLPMRVLVRSDLVPVRRYEPFGLPCFMP